MLYPHPLYLTTSKLYGDCLKVKREYYQNCFILIGNVLPLQWVQLTKTVHTARLGFQFVFLCFSGCLISLCLCMFCFTLDSCVIILHVLALVWQTWMSSLRVFCSIPITADWNLAPSHLGPLWTRGDATQGGCFCRWSSTFCRMGDVYTSLPWCIHLRNDLYCVGWGVHLYTLTHSVI